VEQHLDFCIEQIDCMVKLLLTDINKQQRGVLGALITLDVHGRDVTRLLLRKKVSNVDDFEWSRQLRYYWEEDIDNVVLRQTISRFVYGYEYLGNSFRLVVTPLTDLCYMTLTGAMHMKLGGAPAGPAGTGKTETTKDLAKAMSVYCVVFNCSDQIDYKVMEKFFSGLAQQGAWACYDEFNRIDLEVLSVVAQQVLCIQLAMFEDVKEFEFGGYTIPLGKPDGKQSSFGVFITMNPGYAGRSELPDNLKALFRPVAMMVPDYRLIAEIFLYSVGFSGAFELSSKMSQLYALSSEQLSKQDHYDFGMRAVKTLLYVIAATTAPTTATHSPPRLSLRYAAGILKQQEPNSPESMLLARAMRDSNVPKFLVQDLPLFAGICADLFPGLEVPMIDYGALADAIGWAIDELNLQHVPGFISKVIQVHEVQTVRHGMMIIGESGAGKTESVKVRCRVVVAFPCCLVAVLPFSPTPPPRHC